MSKPSLLATATTLEDLRQAVCKFYGGESKTLIPISDDRWKVIGTYSSQEAPGVQVRRLRGRFRFEMLAP